jgi:hypothetical protein
VASFDSLVRGFSASVTRVRTRRRVVVFAMHDDESYWCDRAGRLCIHGVWSVEGLPSHIAIENVYAQRPALRWRRGFPFVRLRQRARAIEYGGARRRLRGSGRIEADFILPPRGRPQGQLNVTVTFVDQVNRRYRARCAFEWRGAESPAHTSVSPIVAL